MAALGADYSYARPGGAALKAAGVTAVGRYLAADGRGITAAEYQDLITHGVGVWLCREGSGQEVLGGFAQGVAQAQIAVQQLAAQGLPANSVVYATVDFDILPAQYAVADAYFDGWNTIIPGGASQTGGYGGIAYLNHLHATGRAHWFWVSASTSFAHGQTAQMPIHLQQTTNTPPVPGTDHDYIYDTTTLAGNGGVTILEDDDMPKYQIVSPADNAATKILVGPGVVFPIPNMTWEVVLEKWVTAINAGTPIALTAGQWNIVQAALAPKAVTTPPVDEAALAKAVSDAVIQALPPETTTADVQSAVSAAIKALHVTIA